MSIAMLTRYDPLRTFDHLLRQTGLGDRFIAMPMDAYRRGDEFVVELDLPGVERDSIDVTVERNVLQVTAQRAAHHGDDDQVLAAERPRGTITRQLFLDRTVDADGIKATYDDGVLTLVFPVAEEAKPRKIAIGNGQRTAVGAGERA